MALPKIIKVAKKRKLDGIAITDHDKLPVFKNSKEIEIIPGCEITTTDAGHVLAYYIQEEAKGTFDEVLDNLKEQDAIVALAHPTDLLRGHFKDHQLLDNKVDAIEILNGRSILSRPVQTKKAAIGGSDAHFYEEVGKIVTEFKGSLREAIKKRSTTAIGDPGFPVFNSAKSVFRKVVHR